MRYVGGIMARHGYVGLCRDNHTFGYYDRTSGRGTVAFLVAMKNIYNITVGQLIAVWAFGCIGWFFTLQPALDYNVGFALFLLLFIPFALVFYTIGWRNHRKSNSQ